LLDEDGRFTAAWNVLVYPSTFIISPEGVIVYGVNGAIEWDSDEVVSALEALLSS
jgi:peroxiredoxin